MKWNWQADNWPGFTWNQSALEKMEEKFLHKSGLMSGAMKHFRKSDRENFTIEIMSSEAVQTSEIEGEILNREPVQSSIRRNFGFQSDNRRASAGENGIAMMMVDVYTRFNQPLSNDMLFQWHKLLTNGRSDLRDIACYRTHTEPMQVVSGAIYDPKIHFEAPPSCDMTHHMAVFIDWFNKVGGEKLSPLVRAGICHLYFVSIHPFEDGNGRIGRAVTEKSLSQALGQPTLLALSQIINKKKKDYYRNLELFNKDLEITGWLTYFSEMILEAQDYSIELIDFLIAKTKLYDRIKGQINERQIKVLERMFDEGLDGFSGGLSAENYISITGTTRPTTTRDLADLVDKGALLKTGERKHTRYWINLEAHRV